MNLIDNITPLARKALLVKFQTSKPGTSRRDHDAEAFAQQGLHDNGLKVVKEIFSNPGSPVRRLMARQQSAYRYHMARTLPYEDRGDRLLPLGVYEAYRDYLRREKDGIAIELANVLAQYDALVAHDIAARGSRAVPEDYPSAKQFEEAFGVNIVFKPIPDTGHFLFDVSDEDKANLSASVDDAHAAAQRELHERMKQPLLKLIDKLAIPIGEKGHIFRDSAVENVAEAAALVKQMGIGDAQVTAAADALLAMSRPLIQGMDALRESPVVREEARRKLDAVASKLGFMFPSN